MDVIFYETVFQKISRCFESAILDCKTGRKVVQLLGIVGNFAGKFKISKQIWRLIIVPLNLVLSGFALRLDL